MRQTEGQPNRDRQKETDSALTCVCRTGHIGRVLHVIHCKNTHRDVTGPPSPKKVWQSQSSVASLHLPVFLQQPDTADSEHATTHSRLRTCNNTQQTQNMQQPDTADSEHATTRHSRLRTCNNQTQQTQNMQQPDTADSEHATRHSRLRARNDHTQQTQNIQLDTADSEHTTTRHSGLRTG